MPKKYGGGSGGPVKVAKAKPGYWFPPPVGASRWSGYHHNPTIRAKDNSKGANKKRSHDDSPWRGSYSGGGLSSAYVLDRLADQDHYPDSEEEEEDDNYDYGSGYGGDHYYADDDVAVGVEVVEPVGVVVDCGPHSSPGVEIRDVGGGGDEDEDEEEEGDDDCMSFCEVGFVVDQVEESDWCLVEEM